MVITLFIWIGANTANVDTTVGITHLNKKCDFKFNNLILNNNQPVSYLFTRDIIWIGIISRLTYRKVFIALISRITVINNPIYFRLLKKMNSAMILNWEKRSSYINLWARD